MLCSTAFERSQSMGSTFNSLVGLIILALDIWAILNVIKSGSEVGSKVLWILLIALLPVVGLVIWAIAGPRGMCGSECLCWPIAGKPAPTGPTMPGAVETLWEPACRR